MTPSFVLLARACAHPAEACYIVARLRLERPARSRSERLEFDMWGALRPVLVKHGGHAAAVRRECPPRWQHALDVALCLPEWFLERAEPTPDLLKRWIHAGSRGWELPGTTVAAPARHTLQRAA